MKKFIVPALFAFLFVTASCMNMSGGSEKGGSIRVALPGGAREISSSTKADTYIVELLLNETVVQTETGSSGGGWSFQKSVRKLTQLKSRLIKIMFCLVLEIQK